MSARGRVERRRWKRRARQLARCRRSWSRWIADVHASYSGTVNRPSFADLRQRARESRRFVAEVLWFEGGPDA